MPERSNDRCLSYAIITFRGACHERPTARSINLLEILSPPQGQDVDFSQEANELSDCDDEADEEEDPRGLGAVAL